MLSNYCINVYTHFFFVKNYVKTTKSSTIVCTNASIFIQQVPLLWHIKQQVTETKTIALLFVIQVFSMNKLHFKQCERQVQNLTTWFIYVLKDSTCQNSVKL